ncbi:MAG TPA: ABC transporter permease [Vicinamibacterales bacterium]|jgi:lipopolysaccharide transport system permease protein|nr:ABC transporter permease [Vicinamibacterales bacterium]
MLRNLSQLPRYRALVQSLVARELKARYRGSVLGFFWSFINPLLLLTIYTFVFKYVMPAAPQGTDPYPLFMFCGLLPWTWFSSSLIESSGVLISGGNLIKKVLFPAEILPIVTVTANMVHFFLALPILVFFLVWFRAPLTVGELAWFPVVVLVQYVFTLGCALVLSALTVHFRDIKDILANLLTLWFFATPIIYSYQFAPAFARRFMNLNPFAHLAISYQEILFFPGPFGHWKWLVALGVASVAFFLFGYFVFDRLRDSFAEEV